MKLNFIPCGKRGGAGEARPVCYGCFYFSPESFLLPNSTNFALCVDYECDKLNLTPL